MNGHLSDNELQEYAIDTSALSQPAIAHITSCENCRVKAQQYAQITAGLKHLPKMTVELDMAAFPLAGKRKRISLSDLAITASFLVGLLVIAAGAAAMGPDIRALVLAGKGLHFYLLPAIALMLLAAGSAFYYKEYKQQLGRIDLLN